MSETQDVAGGEDDEHVFVDPMLPSEVRTALEASSERLLTARQKRDLPGERPEPRGVRVRRAAGWLLSTAALIAMLASAQSKPGTAITVVVFGLCFIGVKGEEAETAGCLAVLFGLGILVALPFVPVEAMAVAAAVYLGWLGLLLALRRDRAGSRPERKYRRQYVRLTDLDGDGRDIAMRTVRASLTLDRLAESVPEDVDVAPARQLIAEQQWHIVQTLALREQLRSELVDRIDSTDSPQIHAAAEPQTEVLEAVRHVMDKQAEALTEYVARVRRAAELAEERRQIMEIADRNDAYADLIALATGGQPVEMAIDSPDVAEAERERDLLTREMVDAGQWLSQAAAQARAEVEAKLTALRHSQSPPH
ncbi:hypothetical protein QCN29_19735 [Streptomyces sp. HNM0663]|uniref:Integral membrane protein n=1 Tax=Streptomyces chengmaiensis TaxID=3040919 RepID=A0ABT6HQU4_9ACTN|nr:hypothetical protein [Streptomyces chengmaiensis]MDH2390980.1 hypothetical protein [Streptomyces chengmaiensis]